MKINRQQAIEVNNVLAKDGLKATQLSNESYVKLLYLKRKIINSLKDLIESEEILKKDFPDVNIINTDDIKKQEQVDKLYNEKLKALQDDFSIEIYDPFMSLEEFKLFAENLDVNHSSVIAEILLKDFW